MFSQAFLMILVTALLNATLIFPMAAAFASDGRALPNTVPRWVVPLLGGAVVAILFPLERALRENSARNLGALTPLIGGSTLALLPVIVALGLTFRGLPLLDVRLASAFSFALILYWAWCYRTFLSGPRPSRLSRPYSIVLALVAMWQLARVVPLVARGMVAETQAGAALLWYTAALFSTLAISCLLVAQLRRSCSAYSLPATTALSFWLAIDLPLGTAASIYWLLRVRKQEATESAV